MRIKIQSKESCWRLMNIGLGLLILYYVLPIMINLTDKFRYLYLIFALATYGVGFVLYAVNHHDHNSIIALGLFEVFLLIYWLFVWHEQLTISNYLMPTTTFNIFCVTAYIILHSKHYESVLFWLIIITNLITAITTIIGVKTYPFAVRNSTRVDLDYGVRWLWRSLNIGTWNYLYGLVFCVPCGILLIKNAKNKLMWLIFTTLSLYCIAVSQLTIALLLAVIITVLFLANKIKTKSQLILLLLRIGVIIIVFINVVPLLLKVREIALNNNLRDTAKKISELILIFSNNDASGNASDRMKLYGMSLSSFFHNPIVGSMASSSLSNKIGFHSEICDILGGLGILGVMGIASFVWWQTKNAFILDNKQYTREFLILLGSFIALAVVNPVLYVPQVALNVFLLPSLTVLRLQSLAGSSMEKIWIEQC